MKSHVMIIALVALCLMAFSPAQTVVPPEPTAVPTVTPEVLPPDPPIESAAPGTSVTEMILAIALQFGTLLGVGGLIAATVNILKLTPLVTDGNTGQWYAGLSLVAFLLLIYFNVFRGVDLVVIDDQSTRVAQILLFVGMYLSQLGAGQFFHDVLKKLGLPLVSTSFSK